MKIIAIRLKNLTSIEGSVEIDFTMEPLALFLVRLTDHRERYRCPSTP